MALFIKHENWWHFTFDFRKNHLLLHVEGRCGARRHALCLLPHWDAHNMVGLVHTHQIALQADGDNAVSRRNRKALANFYLVHVKDRHAVDRNDAEALWQVVMGGVLDGQALASASYVRRIQDIGRGNFAPAESARKSILQEAHERRVFDAGGTRRRRIAHG